MKIAVKIDRVEVSGSESQRKTCFRATVKETDDLAGGYLILTFKDTKAAEKFEHGKEYEVEIV